MSREPWPAIPYPDWAETCTALHLYVQILGKYRLAHTPWVNHAWHATLYPSSCGLTTGPVPDAGGHLTLELDVHAGRVVGTNERGAGDGFELGPGTVAQFHSRVRDLVTGLGGTFDIHGHPNELAEAVPFVEDDAPRPWDAEAVRRFHRALVSSRNVFDHFRTAFLGKVSPVHLFWGSFDLAVTRFSGRTAPPHPGGMPNLPDEITREAYSHEVSSAGFWPGVGVGEPMFYSYAYPTPEGFADTPVEPAEAGWNAELGEFLLPYEAVRTSDDPEGMLMRFLLSTYGAAADAAGWDRDALECEPGRPRVVRPVRAA